MPDFSDHFTTPGDHNWQRYPGVTTVTWRCYGPDGDGGFDPTTGGGGGGGGGYGEKTIPGLTDSSYPIHVGAHGSGEDTQFQFGTNVKGSAGGNGSTTGGAGGTGTGDVTHTGGNGADGGQPDGSSGLRNGGGGGERATSTGDGASATDINGVGGGGNGGDILGDPEGQNSSPTGGGGGDSAGGDGAGGQGADGELFAEGDFGSLDVTDQPANANSGDTNSATFRIKDSDGNPDNNADTAGAGNTVTITLNTVSGSGSLNGTTTYTYSAASATCNSWNVSGDGHFTITCTDDATGVQTTSNEFIVTAPAVTAHNLLLLGAGV